MANRQTILGWLLALIALIALVEGYAPEVHAMPPASKELAALLLARTCVREAGWEITADCAAIHEVVQKRADIGSSTRYEQMISLYSRPSPGRPWLEELEYSASEPPSWPEGARWAGVHREKWLAVLAHAKAIVAGTVVSTCVDRTRAEYVSPDHWGDHKDDSKRALKNGWIQIDCAGAKNAFWVVPQRRAASEQK